MAAGDAHSGAISVYGRRRRWRVNSVREPAKRSWRKWSGCSSATPIRKVSSSTTIRSTYLGRQRILDFAAAMKSRGLRIPWGCNARADHWDRELLQELRDTGLFTLRIGIESGDQRVLDLSGKDLNLEEARRTLEISASLGIQNHIMFVIGLAGENRESVENTIAFIKSVPCHSVQFSVAVPFPGTSLYRDAEAKGHLVTRDWSKYSGFGSRGCAHRRINCRGSRPSSSPRAAFHLLLAAVHQEPTGLHSQPTGCIGASAEGAAPVDAVGLRPRRLI